MKNLETSIQIKASANTVWNILMDFEQYPQWNPLIRQLTGEAVKGKSLKAKIQPPGQKPMDFEPVVLECTPAQEFRWLGKLFIKGLFDGEHYFKIKRIDSEKVEFIHGENFRGLLVTPLMAMIGKSTEEGFLAMNQALKTLAESKQQDHAKR